VQVKTNYRFKCHVQLYIHYYHYTYFIKRELIFTYKKCFFGAKHLYESILQISNQFLFVLTYIVGYFPNAEKLAH